MCVVGACRNWLFSSDMSFLMVFSDWLYHLHADFCFLVGGASFTEFDGLFGFFRDNVGEVRCYGVDIGVVGLEAGG